MFTLIFSTIIIVLGIMQFSISMFYTDNQIKRLYILGECTNPEKHIKITRLFFRYSGLSLATFATLWGLGLISDISIVIILVLFAIALYIFTHTKKDSKSVKC